jgi:hypothetical protein
MSGTGTSGTRTSGTAKAGGGRAGQVVVIPEGGRFHRPTCRFVRDQPGARPLRTAQAVAQGYAACGVCKP